MRTPYAILIDGPGEYLTQSGAKIEIFEVKETGASYPCHGYTSKPDSLGRIRKSWKIWALDGRYGCFAGSKMDIVRKL